MNSLLCYSDLIRFESFKERYDYLRLPGSVGISTFGFDRYLNQSFYQSAVWRKARDEVIIRDKSCDLAHPDYEVRYRLVVHHMNIITVEDVEFRNPDIWNPEFLITTCEATHRAIHYGDFENVPKGPVVRSPNDTVPWRNSKGGS